MDGRPRPGHADLCGEAIMQSAMDGFFILDAECRFLEVNDAFCRMTGYESDELRKMKISDLEAPIAARGLAATTRLKTGLHHFNTAHRRKDGALIQLESSVSVVRDGGRKLLVGFARDATERCRAEEALMRSEKKYRDLVETSSDLIWTVDREGRWTFVNSAARRVYGQAPQELLGRKFSEFSLPDCAEADARMVDLVLNGHSLFHYETLHVRRDGRTIELSFNATATRNELGEIIGVTGTAVDLTDQRRAERELQDANERFGKLVARMPLGYVVWTRDLRVREWNPAAEAIFGFTAAEALGRTADDLIVPPAERDSFARAWERLLKGENGNGAIFRLQTRSGETVECEWFSTVLPNTEGESEFVATMIRDVSEREKLESQLRQTQKLESLGILAGGIAHDFNNLLTAIQGNVDVALELLPDTIDGRAQVQKIANINSRASELTRKMLAYAGKSVRDVQPLDLNELVREMPDLLRVAVPRNIELETELGENLPPIDADSAQVQQVIMNLLMNAAEAIGERPGSVRLATRAERLTQREVSAMLGVANASGGEYLCLTVSDNGCGMTPATTARIFEPFFSTKFAGRGLGLAAILGIVRSHGGLISVKSRIGEGTTFRIAFPAGKMAVDAPRAERPDETSLPRGATVLVIDDEDDIREVVETILTARGMTVLCAPDGPSGVELFRARAREIDVILLDLTMPGMTGEAVFRAIKEIRADAKVIVSSGYSEQDAAARFGGNSPAGFVHKPYTARALLEQLGSVVRGTDAGARKPAIFTAA